MPPQFAEQRGRIIRDTRAGGGQRRNRYPSGHAFLRWPKSAVPTRTQVAPSSIAVSKSFDIPIESCGNSNCSANSRKRAKYGREGSASSDQGGTVISPVSFTWVHARTASTSPGRSRRVRAVLALLRRKLDLDHHFERLAALIQPPREFGGIHGLMALNSSQAFLDLLDCKWPMR